MTNMLNEEIRAIRHTITHLKQGIVLEPDSGKREKMRKDINELTILLESKLNQCGDYH